MGPPESSTPEPAHRAGDDPDSTAIEVRRATEADLPQILALAQRSLGWSSEDPNESFFRWKHFENPAGPSPMWVATAGRALVGLRVFLRWPFVQSGRARRAVRAVDTATHPDHQGKGIFSRLTLGAIDELRADGIDFIFNTPNEQSRPGYLKMGWESVGRVPIAVRPRGLASLTRMSRARVPAAKWSLPTEVGRSATDVLADDDALDRLLRRTSAAVSATDAARLATDRSGAHLRWRYGFEPLHYRAITPSGRLADGLVIFRLRRRGPAVEAVVCERLAPDRRVGRALVAEVARSTGADYVILAGAPDLGSRLLPASRLGPILTWRQVAPDAREPALADWDLAMGDVELF